MGIEQYRAEMKDDYIGRDITCPHCGGVFRKTGGQFCPKCFTKIFFRDEGGRNMLIEPEKQEKTRRYAVKGASKLDMSYFPGERVKVKREFPTDVNGYVYANGEELTAAEDGCYYFLMPPFGVEITFETRGGMTSPPAGFITPTSAKMPGMNTGMNMSMGMNMGMNAGVQNADKSDDGSSGK